MLSYKLLFCTERDVTVAAIILAIVCACATALLLAPDGEDGLWLAEARGACSTMWTYAMAHFPSAFALT